MGRSGVQGSTSSGDARVEVHVASGSFIVHPRVHERLTFTRSGPYRKNDNCFVEEKNYTAVPHMVAYYRYDTPTEQAILNRIYDLHRLYFNFFQPQMKLQAKTRVGSKVTRRYVDPKTPYRRVLDSNLDESVKQQLRAAYSTLNPAARRRQITDLQHQLWRLVTAKELQRTDHVLGGSLTMGQ